MRKSRRICFVLVLMVCSILAIAQQYGRPVSTEAAGNWTESGAATLHEAVDEVVPNDDMDYISSSSITTARFGVSPLTDPLSSSGHVLRIRLTSSGGLFPELCDFRLYQGTTVVAAITGMSSRNNYRAFTYTLSAAEADAITDYTDLWFEVEATYLFFYEEMRVTWMELEVPSTVPVLSAPTVTNVDMTVATLGATLDDAGAFPVTERGTVWGTSPSPTGNLLAEGGTSLGAYTHVRSGMPSGTQIYFRGYADNASGRGYSPDGSFYTEPTQCSDVTFSGIGSNAMTVNWTMGGGDGAIVLMRLGSPVPELPVDGVEHVASSTFGAGELLGTDTYVVYRGPANSVLVIGLSPNTSYYVAVFEYAGSGTGISGINYQQDVPAEGNEMTVAGSSGHNANYGIQCDQCHALHGGSLVPRENEQLAVCAQCHNATGAASSKIDIALHVVDGGTTIIDCGSCHEVHNGYDFNTTNTHSGGVTAPNTSLIRWDVTKYVTGAIEPAVFQVRPDHFVFSAAGDGPPYNGICQACHTATNRHNNTGVGANNNHRRNRDCMDCHPHIDGFLQ